PVRREQDMTGAVPGFDVTTFSHGGHTHEVYLAGAGPAVIVVHEIPGLHPGVTAFGQRIADAGYRVYLPSLFGRPGVPFGARETIRSLLRVCVSREFVLLADRTSPVVTWLRALAARAHAECGGPGWARSACVSPAGSPWPWRWSRPCSPRSSASRGCRSR